VTLLLAQPAAAAAAGAEPDERLTGKTAFYCLNAGAWQTTIQFKQVVTSRVTCSVSKLRNQCLVRTCASFCYRHTHSLQPVHFLDCRCAGWLGETYTGGKDAAADRSGMHVLSWDPRIMHYRRFLSEREFVFSIPNFTAVVCRQCTLQPRSSCQICTVRWGHSAEVERMRASLVMCCRSHCWLVQQTKSPCCCQHFDKPLLPT
jgi:hypothetical protein